MHEQPGSNHACVLRELARPAVLAVAALLLSTVVAACGLFNPAPKEPTPREALDRAAEAMEQLKSAHFSLETEGGALQLGPGISVATAEGDVVSPDRVRLKFTLRLGTMSAESQLVAIGEQLYLTNPLTGRWEKVPVKLAAPQLLHRERGVSNVLRKVADPQKIATETLDGARTYHLRGSVPASPIAQMVGGQPMGESVVGEVWVDADDFRVRQVRLEGAIGPGDKATTVRLLKLSRFDEPISIEPPL
ncbi:MAG: LppX_LprAFG lipoprotein [Chloroflexi bacterium]|nr:LppX_LprAFG lipoprotein [Chloroflexota bacterium]